MKLKADMIARPKMHLPVTSHHNTTEKLPSVSPNLGVSDMQKKN